MEQVVRDITSAELMLFGDIVARLARADNDMDIRAGVLRDVVRLVKADFAASFVWSPLAGRFEGALIHDMDPKNIQNYNSYFQYHDPHTFQLRAKRRATLVEEVMPYSKLRRTEFYNDFLSRDGLHHGMNIFFFDGDRDLGDFRLWRAASSPDFGAREIALLNAIAPHLQAALRRGNERFKDLTVREREVAFLVARGCRDRDIGNVLGIGFSTVRTHLTRAMEKKGCANRAELAAAIMHDGRASP